MRCIAWFVLAAVASTATVACRPLEAGVAPSSQSAPPSRAGSEFHAPRTNAIDAPATLRRPLVPVQTTGSDGCLAAPGRSPNAFPGASGFGLATGYVAYGSGSVAVAFHGPSDAAVLSFSKMPQHEGAAFEKVLLIAPSARGPILLVRAVSSDGVRARFMTGDELVLSGPGTHGMGYVYFPKPGCYSLQVDDSDGTQRVTVKVAD